MLRTRFLLPFLWVFIFTAMYPAYSQNFDCVALLKGGVFDYRNTISSSSNINNFLTYVDQKKYKSVQSFKKDATNFGLSVAAFDLNFGNEGQVSYKNKQYSSFTNLYQSNAEFQSMFQEKLSTASEPILKAFNECIKSVQGDKYQIWAHYNESFSRVIVSVRRLKHDPLIPTLKIVNVLSPGAEPEKNYKGQVIGSDPINLIFKITDSKADLLTFDLVTNDKTGSYRPHVEIQKVVEDVGPTDPPASRLPAKLLVTTKTNGSSKAGTCEEIWIYFNNLTSGWRLDNPGNTFKDGRSDRFYIDVGVDLGDIKTVRIEIKNSQNCQGNNGWICDYVQIENLRTGQLTRHLFKGKTFDLNSNAPSYTETDVSWELPQITNLRQE